MNFIPAYERMMYVTDKGHLTDGVNQNLEQLYTALQSFGALNNGANATQLLIPSQKAFDAHTGLTTFVLPNRCHFGDFVAVLGGSPGGWRITQGPNQQIRFGTLLTTPGVGGSLNAANIGSCVMLVCTSPDEQFIVESFVGVLTTT